MSQLPLTVRFKLHALTQITSHESEIELAQLTRYDRGDIFSGQFERPVDVVSRRGEGEGRRGEGGLLIARRSGRDAHIFDQHHTAKQPMLKLPTPLAI